METFTAQRVGGQDTSGRSWRNIPHSTTNDHASGGDRSEGRTGRTPSTGDRYSTEQRSSRDSNRHYVTRLLQSNFSSRESIRRMATRHRPVVVKYIHRNTTVQDDDVTTGHSVRQSRGLGDIHRFDRRIFSNTNQNVVTKVPTFRMGRSSIPVQSAPVRHRDRTAYCHKGYETSHQNATNIGNTIIPLHRRLDDSSGKRRHVCQTHSLYSSLDAVPRLRHQRSQVQSRAVPECNISGNVFRSTSRICTANRETIDEDKIGSEQMSLRQSICKDVAVPIGNVEFMQSPGGLRQVTHQNSTTFPAVTLESETTKSKHYDYHTNPRCRRCSTMVVGRHKCHVRNQFKAARSAKTDVYRRQYIWLGSTYGRPYGSRCLDRRRKMSSH